MRGVIAGFIGVLVAAPAWAVDVSAGGKVVTGLQTTGGAVGTVLSQAEVDVAGGGELVTFDLQLDYHFDPYWLSGGSNADYTLAPHYPLPPESAMVQIGQERYILRLGVTNPTYGLQSWDEDENYLPSYSQGWTLTNGQNLGAEVAYTLGDGSEVEVYGGYDLGWLAPAVGVSYASEQDAWGTWTGGFYQPTTGFALLVSANEVYPTDWLWVTAEGQLGAVDGAVLGAVQGITSFNPEGMVGGALRYEHTELPVAAATALEVGMASDAVAAAVNCNPASFLHLSLEAKEAWPGAGADPAFTGTLLVSGFTPVEE